MKFLYILKRVSEISAIQRHLSTTPQCGQQGRRCYWLMLTAS